MFEKFPKKTQVAVTLAEASLKAITHDYGYSAEETTIPLTEENNNNNNTVLDHKTLSAVDAFLEDRAACYFPTHHSAVITSDFYAGPKNFGAKETTDACVIDYVFNKHGVRDTLTMATASAKRCASDNENESTALVNLASCEVYVNATNQKEKNKLEGALDLKLMIQDIGPYVVTKVLENKIDKSVPFQPKTSLLACTVIRKRDNTLNCVVNNIGDGMLLVINHRLHTIDQITETKRHIPLQRHSSMAEPIALAIQDLPDPSQFNLDKPLTFEIEEDDIIVHLTKGVWQELLEDKTENNNKKENKSAKSKSMVEEAMLKEFKLAPSYLAAINEFMQQEKDDKPLPAYKIAAKIMEMAAKSALAKRSKIIQARKKIETVKPQQEDNNIVDTPDEQLHKSEQPTEPVKMQSVAQTPSLDQIMKEVNAGNERIERRKSQIQGQNTLNNNEAIQEQVQEEADEKLSEETGDYATVAVMRVPQQKEEWLRALVECNEPARIDGLFQEVTTLFTRDEINYKEIQEIADRLSHEIAIPNDQSGQEQVNWSEMQKSLKSPEHIYAPKQLKLVEWINVYNALSDALKMVDHRSFSSEEKKQEKLRLFQEHLTTKGLDIYGMSKVFNAFKDREDLNKHKNIRTDILLGKKNTNSYIETFHEIREAAKNLLWQEVNAIQSKDEKQQLLKWAKQQPLLNEHRNNSLWLGAFWRTATIREIEKQEQALQKEPSPATTINTQSIAIL